MTIIVVENVSESLKGDISKWLFEIKSGVFVGKLNSSVRDELWSHLIGKISEEGTLIQIWSDNSEQSFNIRYHNPKNFIPSDFDGLWLFRKLQTM